MQEQLNYLIQMQQLDNTIELILIHSQDNPRKVALVNQETQKVQEVFQNFKKEMEDVKKQRKILEREVEEFDQRIKKSQVKLMEVKTNKEYRAMLTEIEELKKFKTGKEDLLLEFLEKAEEGAKKEKALKGEVEVKIAEEKVIKKQLEKEGRGYEEEISELNRKRKGLSSRVDSGLLKQYEFLRERLRGMAVAEVKEATCLGCHMLLPPQLYNELHRQDRIITCPSCLRILYLSAPPGTKEDG
ncbi:MAG: C4-type zinc ribbon domain-containing protein [Thermodesulfobacteriota bacterium]